jgi:uncharacterized protein (TIGR02271 family)
MRTITALYDSRADAEHARAELAAAGLATTDVQITAADEAATGTSGSTSGDSGEPRGFLASLKDFFMPDEDRHAYSEGVRRGGSLLTVRVAEEDADQVCSILEDTEAVDVDARQHQWAQEGWKPGAWREQATLTTHDTDQTIPVVDEELRVGKREVERGGVRVRSYVQERPVEEQVNLREEHVEIERRPVDRPVTAADGDNLFQERTIELTETAEEPVVDKQAHVREEIGLRKEVDQRTETIADTERHTEVDVEDTRGTAGGYGQSQSQGQGFSGERASFRADDDSSIAMEGEDGSRIGETEEERRERLLRERDAGTGPASRI